MSTPLAAEAVVGDLRLVGDHDVADIDQALTGGELVQTISGASSLTLTVHDPHRRILTSGLLESAALDVTLDGEEFRLAGLDKADDDLTLTFEALAVALLRTYRRPRKAFRDQMTRAQFARALVAEVTERRLAFWSPSLVIRQPIESTPRQRTITTTTPTTGDPEPREPGFADGATITVNGTTATAEQRDLIARALRVAHSLDAPSLAMLALLVAGTAESTWRNLTYGDSSSVGVLQLLDIHGSVESRRNVERVVGLFLTQGFTGAGGAIGLAREHPDWSPAQIATTVQGNRDGASTYAGFVDEARRTLSAYAGDAGDHPTAAATTRTTSTTVERYEFSRGQPGTPEDSWTALGRLAEEVGWRCYERRNEIVFASDLDLLRIRPLATLIEGEGGVDRIDFRADSGRAVEEATVTLRAGRWQVPPGRGAVVEEQGPGDGRWLVGEARRSLFSIDSEVSLVRPTRAKAEPAPQTSTTTRTTTSTTTPPRNGLPGALGRLTLPLSTTLPTRSEFTTPDPEGAPAASGVRYHAAMDWFAPGGTQVRSPEAGRIVESRQGSGTSGQVFGGTVKVQARDGQVWVFRHVAPTVELNATVQAGQAIATVVRWTDNPSSSHAHIERWRSLSGGYVYENMTDPLRAFRR